MAKNYVKRQKASEIFFNKLVKGGLLNQLFPGKKVIEVYLEDKEKDLLDWYLKIDRLIEVDGERKAFQFRILDISPNNPHCVTIRNQQSDIICEWDTLDTIPNMLFIFKNKKGEVVRRCWLETPKDLKKHVIQNKDKQGRGTWGFQPAKNPNDNPFVYFNVSYLQALAILGIIQYREF